LAYRDGLKVVVDLPAATSSVPAAESKFRY
jgi:hypothetical protein